MNEITFSCNNKAIAEKLFTNALERGYLLKTAMVEKKYLFFGEKRYVVVMNKELAWYELAIQEAVKNENYEEADKLLSELESLNKLPLL